jgi:hypothetical protein
MSVPAYTFRDMTSVEDDGEDIHHKIITEILNRWLH